MIEGILNLSLADDTHISVYSTAQAFPTYVKTKASFQEITSRGLKEESSFKTAILSTESPKIN